jgi:hypothetical protein
MTTRDQRLAEYTTKGEPPSDMDLELLCEDHIGTYSLSFPCRRINAGWRNGRTGEELQGKVLGWRPWNGLRR